VERLQQREREVLRAEQLAAVGQLAAGLAHELRNPLMPIKIMVQAASDQGNGAGLHGRDLAIIEHEITRLEQSIQDFLDFARPPEPEKTGFDLRPVVQQTLDLLTARADRQHVQLNAALTDEVVAVVADRGQLRQVLVNLMLNALDAMPEGGEIDVSLHVERSGEPALDSRLPNVERLSGVARLPESDFVDRQRSKHGGVLLSRQFARQDSVRSALPDDRDELQRRSLLADSPGRSAEIEKGTIVLCVGDNGSGIEPEILPRVFQPFVSTKETGTGLGLSICQRIIEAHGGTIEVRNRPNGGAEFICRLPSAVSERPPAPVAALPGAAL